MKDRTLKPEKKAFVHDHPDGIAVSDINIAAALLCCGDVKGLVLKPKSSNSREMVFVLKGDKEVLSKRAMQFFTGRIDSKRINVGGDGMAVAGLFAQKMRDLKAMIKNGIRGEIEMKGE